MLPPNWPRGAPSPASTGKAKSRRARHPAAVSATLKPSRRDKWDGSDHLERVQHGTTPKMRPCAHRGARKGGSLPYSTFRLGRPSAASTATVTHSGRERYPTGDVQHGRALSRNRGSLSVLHPKKRPGTAPKPGSFTNFAKTSKSPGISRGPGRRGRGHQGSPENRVGRPLTASRVRAGYPSGPGPFAPPGLTGPARRAVPGIEGNRAGHGHPLAKQGRLPAAPGYPIVSSSRSGATVAERPRAVFSLTFLTFLTLPKGGAADRQPSNCGTGGHGWL